MKPYFQILSLSNSYDNDKKHLCKRDVTCKLHRTNNLIVSVADKSIGINNFPISPTNRTTRNTDRVAVKFN